MTDNMQTILQAFLGSGWDGLEAGGLGLAPKRADAERASALQQAEQLRIANMVADVFATDDGQKLLSVLIKMTLRRRETDAEVTPMPAEQYSVMKAHRAGQAAIVNWILDMVEIARGDQKPAGG